MDVTLEGYHGRFADIRTGLGREVEGGLVLIEELLHELSSTKTTLEQTKLDLDNECQGRRRLQQEIRENRDQTERQGRRPFVVALIDADADCYVFHDRFITNGEKGGEDAADALLAAMQQYVLTVTDGPQGMDVLVRAFANVSGLVAALERSGRLKEASQLRAFATGFNSRKAFFDFVDVGPGKERADLKIRGGVEFFLESSQCKHLVLACGHDSGYAPFLGNLVGDKQVAERITLLEGSPFPAAIRNLGLKSTQFSSVFNGSGSTAQSALSTGFVRPLWGQYVTAVPLPSADPGSSIVRPMTAGPTSSVAPASPGTPLRHPSNPRSNPQAQSYRLGPVFTDKDGRRIDKPLQVNEALAATLRKRSLCYHYFLRGECTATAKCLCNHEYRPLTDDEFYALWALARRGRCHKSRKADQNRRDDCADAKCVYGHNKLEDT